MEDNTELSVWSKKQSELTVGDSMKVAVAVTVVTTAVAFAVVTGASVLVRFAEKRQERKAEKKLEVIN